MKILEVWQHMAQRILEPGQIESLAQRAIPRIRLPDREVVFARRAARLRALAKTAAMGDYLQLLAALVDAQHAALGSLSVPLPSEEHIKESRKHVMPPVHAATWPLPPQWRATLERVCAPLAASSGFPSGVAQIISRIRLATPAWIEAQAIAILGLSGATEIDIAAAPFIMAALQVHWVALAGHFVADEVQQLDVPGVCPLCGTLPVASIVYAQAQYQGYRYLHCALCATEWHMVRVQCTQCGASGKDIAYHSLQGVLDGDDPRGKSVPAVRAETCEHCHGYRKILYQEKDPAVEPVADDVATLALDLLLGERAYHRAGSNPLLWQSNTT